MTLLIQTLRPEHARPGREGAWLLSYMDRHIGFTLTIVITMMIMIAVIMMMTMMILITVTIIITKVIMIIMMITT